MRIERATIFVIEQAQRARVAFGSAASRPALVRIIALMLIFVIAIPLAALILFLGVVGVAGLLVYVAFRRLRGWARRMLPRDDGRENVRVIRDRA